MADIMKKTFEFKVLPIILNPPAKLEPREQSFNLIEKKSQSQKDRNKPTEEGKKSGGCCK